MTTGLDPILCSNILQNRACKAVIIPVGLAPQDADHESPCSYCGTWVIQCDTVQGAVKPLVRDAHRPGPQYLACSISKATHTHTLRVPDQAKQTVLFGPPISTNCSQGRPSGRADPKQKLDHRSPCRM
jgi:hypothetical protein